MAIAHEKVVDDHGDPAQDPAPASVFFRERELADSRQLITVIFFAQIVVYDRDGVRKRWPHDSDRYRSNALKKQMVDKSFCPVLPGRARSDRMRRAWPR